MGIAGVALFAAQMLFPVADTKPEGYDGARVRVEGGAAVVDVAANHKYSGRNNYECYCSRWKVWKELNQSFTKSSWNYCRWTY